MKHSVIHMLKYAMALCLLLAGAAVAQTSPGDPTAPQRIYINVNESTRLDFEQAVESASMSVQGICRLNQPNDNTLLIEAVGIGRTVVNVVVGGKINRYFVSTFNNRGADVLNLQNEFTAKGYKELSVQFSGDSATLSGSVPTQEELSDAIRIVKTYTPFVDIRANVGRGRSDRMTAAEQQMADRILEIAKVKDLDVLVEGVIAAAAPNPSTQNMANPAAANTADQGRVSGGGATPGATAGGSGGAGGAASAAPGGSTASAGSQTTSAARIYLLGQVDDDLDKARAIRVARMYTGQVISFLTVRDPIQLRVALKFVEVNINKAQTVGFRWPDSVSYNVLAAAGGPAAGAAGTIFARPSRVAGESTADSILREITAGLTTNVSMTLNATESTGVTKVLNEPSISLLNGQAGTFFSGQRIPYPGPITTIANANGTVVQEPRFLPVGVSVLVLPLKASVDPGGVGASASFASFPHQNSAVSSSTTGGSSEPPVLPNVNNYDEVMPMAGTLVDDSMKYVDENGLIGLNIRSSVSAATGFVTISGSDVPQTTEKSISTRAVVRNGQSIVVAGLFDERIQRSIISVPFLSKIPVFGFFFREHTNDRTGNEVLLVFTPTVVRLSDGDNNRVPRPARQETREYMQQLGFLPQIKPIRYDVAGVDLRPDFSANRPVGPRKAPKIIDDEKTVSDAPDKPLVNDSRHAEIPSTTVMDMPVKSSSESAQPVIDTAPPAVDTKPKVEENTPSILP